MYVLFFCRVILAFIDSFDLFASSSGLFPTFYKKENLAGLGLMAWRYKAERAALIGRAVPWCDRVFPVTPVPS